MGQGGGGVKGLKVERERVERLWSSKKKRKRKKEKKRKNNILIGLGIKNYYYF